MNTIKNKVQLTGRLGMDPELRSTAKGTKFVRVSLAVDDSYKNAAGDFVKQVQWHNLIAWGKTAELLADNFQKGSEILIEGKLLINEYTDKEGVKRKSVEIQVFDASAVEREQKEEATV